MKRILTSLPICAASLCWIASAGLATTISGDVFDLTFDGATQEGVTADPNSRFDFRGVLASTDIEFNWVDDDSFDVSINSAGDHMLTLSGLDVVDSAGARYTISGGSFNYGDSGVDTFIQSPGNPSGVPASLFFAPTIATTVDTVTVNWTALDTQLAEDAPFFRFDLTYANASGPNPPPAVPLPAPFALLGLGIAGLFAVGRRS